MKVYKLEKDIENDKLYPKKLKEQLTHSLKRRKELAIKMNENLYIEETI